MIGLHAVDFPDPFVGRWQIDARLASVIQHTKELEALLDSATTAAQEEDIKLGLELRQRGLVLGTEVPLGPSRLALREEELASER